VTAPSPLVAAPRARSARSRRAAAPLTALAAALAACARTASPSLTPPACPALEAPQLIPLPFAPERPFAAWVDPRRVVVAELDEGEGRPPSLRAFALDVERRVAWPLPVPVVDALRGSPSAHFAAVDGRLLVILASTLGDEPIAAHLIDPGGGAVLAVEGAAAPPSGAFLTSPFHAAAGRGGYVHWPRRPGDAVDGPGYVLDALRALWRPAPTDLIPRSGSHIARLGDGRVAVWGGLDDDGAPAGEGATLDLSTGEVRRFAHPRIATSMYAVDGLTLAGAGADPQGPLRGYVLDLERGGAPFFERDIEHSWRNPAVLHLRGDHLAYLAADALHLWRRSSGQWRALDLPFVADAPSEIRVADLADGAWLIDGTDRGAFVLDPNRAAFCGLPTRIELTIVSATLTSPRHRLHIGGAADLYGAAECPPGAPCALKGPTRREDPRAELHRLR
jgi:hypothetical protein